MTTTTAQPRKHLKTVHRYWISTLEMPVEMPSIPTTKAYAEWWADYVFKNFPRLEVVKSVEVEEMTQHKFITHWYHVKEKQAAPHPADLPGQTLMFQD